MFISVGGVCHDQIEQRVTFLSPSWEAEIVRKAAAISTVSRPQHPISVKPQENKHKSPVIYNRDVLFFICNLLAAVIR